MADTFKPDRTSPARPERAMPPIDHLAAVPRARTRRVGTDRPVLYREDDPSRALFVLRSGAIEIFYEDEALASRDDEAPEDEAAGTRVKLEMVRPGDIFGEVEFLARNREGRAPRRLFSARAATASEVVEVPYDGLADLLARQPEVDAFLRGRVVERLHALARATGRARFSDTDVLLANALLDLARTLGVRAGQVVRFREKVPQAEIALAVGLTREVVSQALNRWERAGIVRTGKDQQLVITDRGRVELIAALPRSPRRADHDLALATVDEAIGAGDNFRARNIALQLLDRFPLSPEVRYRACLAAARAGAHEEALRLARRFGFDAEPDALRAAVAAGLDNPVARRDARRDEDADDGGDEALDDEEVARRLARLVEDAAALVPRIHKDLAFAAEAGPVRERELEAALEGYARAHRATGGTFTGINAASIACLLGDAPKAEALARSVLRRLPKAPDGYWDAATIMEAHALLGDWPAARAALARAVACEDCRPGAVASTRLQLTRLRGCLDAAEVDGLLAALPAAPSIAFSGHMMRGAQLGAAEQRAAEEALVPLIDENLDRHGVGRAHGALACGADILIAERVLRRGGELHVVLPMRFQEFVEASVMPGDPPGAVGRRWEDRFDDCLARANSVTIVHDGPFEAGERDALFHQAFRQAAGLALLRADELVVDARLLAVHDGGAADSIAGTGMALRSWAESGHTVHVLPCPWRRGTPGPAVTVATPFRPVVFAWSMLDDARRGRLQNAKRRGRAGLAKAMEAEVQVFRAAVGPLLEGARLLPRTDQTQLRLGIAAVFEDVPAALAGAARLARAAPHAGAGEVRVVCDHGLVLDRRGEPHAERLGRLRAAGDVPEVPSGLVAATEAFAAEARLAAPRAFRAQPMGRVALSGRPGEESAPLPSARLFRIDPQG